MWQKLSKSAGKCSDVSCNGAIGNLNGIKPNERVKNCSEVQLGEV